MEGIVESTQPAHEIMPGIFTGAPGAEYYCGLRMQENLHGAAATEPGRIIDHKQVGGMQVLRQHTVADLRPRVLVLQDCITAVDAGCRLTGHGLYLRELQAVDL